MVGCSGRIKQIHVVYPNMHGQHGKPAAPKLHCQSEFCKFQLVMDFGCPGVRGVLFGIIKQL